MQEKLDEAREELKRADHLLYVSLKYTRTVDVIKSLIERLINCMQFLIESLLRYAVKKRKIAEIPANDGLRANLCLKLYNDEIIAQMIKFYNILRKVKRAEYRRSNEYRRHVTMTAITDDGVINIDIDVIKEYFERTVYYANYAAYLVGLEEKPEEYVPEGMKED